MRVATSNSSSAFPVNVFFNRERLEKIFEAVAAFNPFYDNSITKHILPSQALSAFSITYGKQQRLAFQLLNPRSCCKIIEFHNPAASSSKERWKAETTQKLLKLRECGCKKSKASKGERERDRTVADTETNRWWRMAPSVRAASLRGFAALLPP